MATTKRRSAKPVLTGKKSDDPRSKTWFPPGNNANPRGRPKGSRNKLGEDFLTALQADFAEHGEAVIQTVREERPHEYLKLVAGILPKELNIKSSAVEDLSDDELAAAIAALQTILGSQGDEEGSGEETKH